MTPTRTAPARRSRRTRHTRRGALTLPLLLGVLLTGCTSSDTSAGPGAPGPGGQSAPAYYKDSLTIGPVPLKAAQRAERFRKNGGPKYVQGVDSEAVEEGVPRVVVWSKNATSDGAAFDALRPALLDHLQKNEKFKAPKGYFLDVYGAKGELQHRFDTRA